MYEALNALTVYLLVGRLIFHIRHLNSEVHAEHVVLNDIYEIFGDFGDQFGEMTRGLYPDANIVTPSGMSSPSGVMSTDLLDEVIASLLSRRKDLESHDAAANTLDELVGELTRQSFLLRISLA